MLVIEQACNQIEDLTRCNKIAIQARTQMAVDKEAVGLSIVNMHTGMHTLEENNHHACHIPILSLMFIGAVPRLMLPTPTDVTAATRNSYAAPSSKLGILTLSPKIGISLTFSQSPFGRLFST